MADTKTTFLKRVISAVLAASLVLALGWFGGKFGLYVVCSVAIILGIREFSRLAFKKDVIPASVTYLFWFTSILFYIAMTDWYELGLLWFALANVLFLSGTLWLCRSKVSNDALLPALAFGTFGMAYCVLLPNFAVQTIKTENGEQWFLFLMIVVFFGDTFAYFGGRFFGKHRLMPEVSPKKTIEGAVSGLIGSALGGTVHAAIVFPFVPWYQFVLFCILCGLAAQSGDLIMSLVKRVARVKDSGHIMPGHGGILDRLDGIFIACPLVYTFALYVTPT